VTRHKRSFPTYATPALAAERVRALTTATDPIACLIDEPRLYLLAQRPAAFPLLRTQDCYASMFADYIETIRERQPKVVLARVPEQVCGANDPAAVEEAVFDDLAQSFHPSAAELRPLYRAVEVIQEVCILRLVKDGAGGSGADG
jgi:hypothetical protein